MTCNDVELNLKAYAQGAMLEINELADNFHAHLAFDEI
jgi:hypothetical protein